MSKKMGRFRSGFARSDLDNIVNISEPSQRKNLQPQKTVIHLHQKENGDDASLRGYRDVPIGRKMDGRKSIGGRALLVSCNNDANRITGWRSGDVDFEVHNAVSLHFVPTVRAGTLPEAMATGRVILKHAWIGGHFDAEELPGANRKPNRMIWPQSNQRD